MNHLKQYLAPSKENTTLQISAYQSKTLTPNAWFTTWTSADSCIWWFTGGRCSKTGLPAPMPACSPGILPQGVGELPFLPFIGQFHSVLSKDMEELCHLGLIAFFPPGVIIIRYILRSHTLFYLNLLNITAATYWATMRCITCARCFQPCLNSLQSMHHYLHLRSKTQKSPFIQRHGKL